MNPPNLLKKVASMGVATLAATTTVTMLGTNSAQAFPMGPMAIEEIADICVDASSVACQVGDKVVYGFEFGGDLLAGDDPTNPDKIAERYQGSLIEFIAKPLNDMDFELVLDFFESTAEVFRGTASMSYKIEVFQGTDKIVATGVDSDVFGTIIGLGNTTVEKSEDDGKFTTITSFAGIPQDTLISPEQTLLSVTDNFSTTGTGEINEFSNEFVQVSVPEPASMLGILGVGGLLLGMKRKKAQK